jgi:hypothetical protein
MRGGLSAAPSGDIARYGDGAVDTVIWGDGNGAFKWTLLPLGGYPPLTHPNSVAPAKAGVHLPPLTMSSGLEMDSRLCGNDEML